MPSPKGPQHPSVNLWLQQPPLRPPCSLLLGRDLLQGCPCSLSPARGGRGVLARGPVSECQALPSPCVDVGTQAGGWPLGEAALEISGTQPEFSWREGCPRPLWFSGRLSEPALGLWALRLGRGGSDAHRGHLRRLILPPSSVAESDIC